MTAVRRLLSAVVLAAAFALPAFAADYKALAPLFVDLPGWQGEKPGGMNMDINGEKMVTAERSYAQGDDKSVQASLVIGQAAALGMGGMAEAGTMRIETDDGVLEVLKMDGFTVTRQHDKSDGGMGSVIVHLGPAALFAVNYEGVSADEGMALAKRFDWKKLQAAAK